MAVLGQSRYIIETNIERFEEHLRGGLLDAEQTRTVTALLAEAREELDELVRRSAIIREQTAPEVAAEQRAFTVTGNVAPGVRHAT